MDSKSGFNSRVMTVTQSRFAGMCDALRRQPRCVWTACAATSLFTSQQLFATSFNYPAHLHFIHFAVLAAYLAINGLAHRGKPTDESPKLTAISWVFLSVLACAMAISIGLTLQAVLHFQNTTGLVMLTTISCLVELIILLIVNQSTRRRHDWVWMIPFAIGCAGILGGEYRLMAKGLLTALPAILCTGISRAIYSIMADKLNKSDSGRRRFDMVFACSGLAISAFWLWYFIDEPWSMLLRAFRWKHAPLLVANILSSTVAMLLGKSILLPVLGSEHRTVSGFRNESRTRDTLTILTLTGVTGASSSIAIHRSYTTYVQLGAFIVAILCFGSSSIKESICNAWGDDSSAEYTKLDSTIELEPLFMEGAPASDVSEWSGETRVPKRSRGFITRSLVIMLTIGSVWLLFPLLNFQERTFPRAINVKPILDLNYKASVPVEIVISMYKERVSDINRLITNLKAMPGLADARVSIYLKDIDGNPGNVKSLLHADSMTLLPNVGREGETYLYHILNSWDNLAGQTFFLQANIHNPAQFYPRIENYFIPGRTGMLSLGWTGQICDCHHCTDHWEFEDRTHIFPDLHSRINNSAECTNVLLSYKGQFVVSAARIRGVPKAVYEDLREAFVNKTSWAHQKEFLQGQADSMEAPAFGYVMERMWNLLFQCADGDVGWKCPTLLSGWRIGGGKADCQCFDDEGVARDDEGVEH